MKKTKIICTIGPASSTEETLKAMIQAGMNVARLNFSHGTYPEHQQRIDLIKKIREKTGPDYPIMYRIDLSLALEETYGERMDTVKTLKHFKNGRDRQKTGQKRQQIEKVRLVEPPDGQGKNGDKRQRARDTVFQHVFTSPKRLSRF